MTISPLETRPVPAGLLPPASHHENELALALAGRALQCVEQALTSLTEMTEVLARLDERSRQSPRPRTAERCDVGADTYNLTRQEQRVLTLVAAGLPNRRIAERLGISDKTAKNYVHTVLVKLDVSTRTEAASKALSGRLVDPQECRRVRLLGAGAAPFPPVPRRRAR